MEPKGSSIRPVDHSQPCLFGPACVAVWCHGCVRLPLVCLALVCGSPRCGSQPPYLPFGPCCQRRRESTRSHRCSPTPSLLHRWPTDCPCGPRRELCIFSSRGRFLPWTFAACHRSPWSSACLALGPRIGRKRCDKEKVTTSLNTLPLQRRAGAMFLVLASPHLAPHFEIPKTSFVYALAWYCPVGPPQLKRYELVRPNHCASLINISRLRHPSFTQRRTAGSLSLGHVPNLV